MNILHDKTYRLYYLFCRETWSVVGVYPGLTAEPIVQPESHLLGELRGGNFPLRAQRPSGQAVGQQEGQHRHELREAQPSHEVSFKRRSKS